MLIPFKAKQLLRLIIIHIFFVLFYRLCFLLIFHLEAKEVMATKFFKAVYLGLKFDLRLVLLWLLPVFITAMVPRISAFAEGKWVQRCWSCIFLFLHTIVLMLYLADVGSYAYIKSRVTADLLKFLENPFISASMVWQTYAVVPILFASLVLLYIYRLWLVKWIFKPPTRVNPHWKWNQSLPFWTIFTLLWAGGIYGKLAWYPLRWSEAFFSTQNFVSHFALNPVLYFADTLKFRDRQKVSEAQVRNYYPVMSDYLGVENKDADQLNFLRRVTPEKKLIPTPNIVIIVLESMAAFKSGLFGNQLGATPVLDSLAKESMLFTRFYVPSQATARSMFALVTGLTDLSQVKTGTRNPFIVNQRSILNDFKMHEKYYFLGGSANWGNIRGVFSHNISDLKIFEEGDYKAYDRVDVWGISDLDLFRAAHKQFANRQSDRPFVAVIQSSGFHRPYTIPNKRGDFKPISKDLDIEAWQRKGFINQKEYNSLRFQDYSLGEFFSLAKKSKYYENTIFVIYGDHGLPVLATEYVPAGEKMHYFQNFHVPLVIHAPKWIQPQIIDRISSQLDLLPTLAGLVGIPYENNSMGRDLLDPRFKDQNYAFVYYWYDKPAHFGLLNDRYYYSERLGENSSFYEYTSNTPAALMKDKASDKFKQMQSLARGFYYTNLYLMQHNSR